MYALLFWNQFLPLNLSVFMWKLLNGGVPVDAAIKQLGIPLPSKCICCSVGQQERAPHLFWSSELVNKYGSSLLLDWEFLLLPLSQVCSPIAFLLPSQIGLLRALLPLSLCWELWKGRNEAILNGAVNLGHHVILNTILWLQDLSKQFIPVKAMSLAESLALNCLQVPIKVVSPPSIKWIKWCPLPQLQQLRSRAILHTFRCRLCFLHYLLNMGLVYVVTYSCPSSFLFL